MANYYGPLLQARQKLLTDQRWPALRQELIALSAEANIASDEHFRAPSDYLIIIAHKRP